MFIACLLLSTHGLSQRTAATAEPEKMISLPFDSSVRTTSVSHVSFEDLMATDGKGRRATVRDASVYSVKVKVPFKDLLARVDRWAPKAGYRKTQVGIYFHKGSGAFEIHLYPAGKTATTVMVYYSTRSAGHPILFTRK